MIEKQKSFLSGENSFLSEDNDPAAVT